MQNLPTATISSDNCHSIGSHPIPCWPWIWWPTPVPNRWMTNRFAVDSWAGRMRSDGSFWCHCLWGSMWSNRSICWTYWRQHSKYCWSWDPIFESLVWQSPISIRFDCISMWEWRAKYDWRCSWAMWKFCWTIVQVLRCLSPCRKDLVEVIASRCSPNWWRWCFPSVWMQLAAISSNYTVTATALQRTGLLTYSRWMGLHLVAFDSNRLHPTTTNAISYSRQMYLGAKRSNPNLSNSLNTNRRDLQTLWGGYFQWMSWQFWLLRHAPSQHFWRNERPAQSDTLAIHSPPPNRLCPLRSFEFPHQVWNDEKLFLKWTFLGKKRLIAKLTGYMWQPWIRSCFVSMCNRVGKQLVQYWWLDPHRCRHHHHRRRHLNEKSHENYNVFWVNAKQNAISISILTNYLPHSLHQLQFRHHQDHLHRWWVSVLDSIWWPLALVWVRM